jgi:hypothetical protein
VKTVLEIIGAKGPRATLLGENVRIAVASLDARVEIRAVTDPKEIARRGVARTPALAINGKTVVEGRVPSVQQIATWIAPER